MSRFLACLLLIGGAVGARNQENLEEELTTDRAADGTSVDVVAMQWSSHWSCWIPDNAGCNTAVSDLLPKFLDEYKVDFVNLGMFQLKGPNKELVDGLPPGVPAFYSTFDLQCNKDNIKILYNAAKWEVTPVAGFILAPEVDRNMNFEFIANKMYGCFNVEGETGDRVYGIFPFKLKFGPLKIIVSFSHFPHPPGGSSTSITAVTADQHAMLKDTLGAKINVLKSASASDNVLVIADLNLDMPLAEKSEMFPKENTAMPDLFGLEPAMSSEQVWEAMNISGSPSLVSKTEYKLTCCADKTKKMKDGITLFPPAGNSKFTFAFDRVLADFGTMETVMPLEDGKVKTQYPTVGEECPMYVGAFHKPIIGKISVEGVYRAPPRKPDRVAPILGQQ